MAKELPYLPSYKNVDELFKRIAHAKQPDAFTTRFLSETLGLKASGDRSLITLLKALGFLDPGGRPTAEYGSLKNPSEAGRAIARSLRKAYAPLFSANENAHKLSLQELRGLIAQVAGTDAGVTTKVAGTFNSLVKLSDFTTSFVEPEQEESTYEETPEERTSEKNRSFAALRPEFHYNIQVHLPANASEETYLNIFNALRKAFR